MVAHRTPSICIFVEDLSEALSGVYESPKHRPPRFYGFEEIFVCPKKVPLSHLKPVKGIFWLDGKPYKCIGCK